MESVFRILNDVFNYGIFYFALSFVVVYLLLGFFSARELIFYKKKNSFVDYSHILSSPLAPKVSLIVPAYNEGKSIVQSVRSFMSIYYNDFEVILVNDGSKDDSLATLIATYDLVKVNFAVHEYVPLKTPVKAVYRSTNKSYHKLVVVDKHNGGKADALNAGINVSQKDLIVCIDADCIVEQSALLKMVKPFLEEREQVIATGGVVRIVNSCEVEDGRLVKPRVPDQFLAAVQVMEYLRTFLMSRMAWSRLNGLLIISGALGMFDRKVAIACGGYLNGVVGEDMELVVRMRRYMHEQGRKYRVVYIPDPLCWTEAPATVSNLGRQRNRWTRGTAETLWIHRKLFFNPRYGLLGLLSHPFWFIFEFLGPIVEFLGVIFFLFMAALGYVNWEVFFKLLYTLYCFTIMISVSAIVYEELTYRQYPHRSDILKLLGTALLEPFFYHPLTVFWAIQGNFGLFGNKGKWGKMVRQGFNEKKRPEMVNTTSSANTL
ncbi:MAG: glycosyltransferase family 2 protein [Ferruginibacter sp.]|nr:glycosyltransferase family 2 protein [Cytophagales bacterium]